MDQELQRAGSMEPTTTIPTPDPGPGMSTTSGSVQRLVYLVLCELPAADGESAVEGDVEGLE
ncbi:hypothetical protein, partial [Kitasatospora sp. NPDC050543]|uniref:hypothetical protein n=1 Tax=Kitasatospora sp. NPDC050543 TaxID=3364054 RepID=UPI0037ABBDE0